jgi:serine palmitoyltransferase
MGGFQEIDDLVEDWTPEPLVAKPSAFEEADIEKRPVIVGSEPSRSLLLQNGLLTSS